MTVFGSVQRDEAGLTQAQVNARMQPWGDREISRFIFREALFRRRGLTATEAEAWADRLALRDQDRDDRRLCLECQHIRPQGRCVHRQPVLNDILQRCSHFTFETP
jgi:hypothetical protein